MMIFCGLGVSLVPQFGLKESPRILAHTLGIIKFVPVMSSIELLSDLTDMLE